VDQIVVPGLGPQQAVVGSPLWVELDAVCRNKLSWQKFWASADEWPDAEIWGKMFLGNAMQVLGKALFPSEWTGYELAAGSLPQPPQSGPAFSRSHSTTARPSPAPAPKVPEWIKGLAATDEGAKSNRAIGIAEVRALLAPAIDRQKRVIELMRVGFRDGLISAIPLPRQGGDFLPALDRSSWLTPHADRRLRSCLINPSPSLIFDDKAPLTHWIYVPASQVYALAGRPSGTGPAPKENITGQVQPVAVKRQKPQAPSKSQHVLEEWLDVVKGGVWPTFLSNKAAADQISRWHANLKANRPDEYIQVNEKVVERWKKGRGADIVRGLGQDKSNS